MFRTRLLLATSSALALLAAPRPADAVRPRSQRAAAALREGLQVRAHQVRDAVRVRWHRAPPRAARPWARFAATATGWQAIWDDATGVPLRLFGRGLPAPGASADPAAALAHARATLAAHLALLAPGARVADFAPAANQAHRGVRTVAFRQLAGGIPVLGGQLSFRYKRDRLVAIASEALPDVVAAPPARALAHALGRLHAQAWVMQDLGAAATAGAVDGPFVLPLVGDGGVLGYRTVLRVDAASRTPRGRWDVYVDAASGAPVARRQRLAFAEASVAFDVPVRHPAGERASYPAREGTVTVDGTSTATDGDGRLSWPSEASAALITRASGARVAVNNEVGAEASGEFTVEPEGAVAWSAPDDELIDAQLAAFIHAGVVKDYARTRFAEDLAWLDGQLPVNVNIDDQCNAFSDGDSINFFQGSDTCENTGRLADVVYHEFGHALHYASIIEGAGATDGAFSEGLSDYLAATITGDPAMGRGFFHDDGPLRDIDPDDREHVWPADVGEIHYTGLIFAGAMWDLRKILIAKHGEDAGVRLADRLFYATLQRASSIPATYVEILLEDDDDGDLGNGGPNACEINAVFAAHGLRQVRVDLAPLGAQPADAASYPVEVRVDGLLAQCPGDGVAGATLEWLPRGEPADPVDPARGETIGMAEVDGAWVAAIPAQPPGTVVRYAVTVEFQDGTTQRFPDNAADTRYELYVGEVVELFCDGFESDPFAAGWSHGLRAGEPDDWQWGPPLGGGASGDPIAAFEGDGVLGTDLGGGDTDGGYENELESYARSPSISVIGPDGRWSDVRLQYWRWLTVEDGFFDQATIAVDDEVVWQNFDSNQGDSSATQHLDREWRFHDVPLSRAIDGDALEVGFGLTTDQGLEFGGWTIDAMCVVAVAGKICGDGVLTTPEECDDGAGNSDEVAGACRTTCRVPGCGDGVVDEDEECDDGNAVDQDGCAATCQGEDDGADCGCRVGVGAGPPPGAAVLALLGLAAVTLLRRRRRL